MDIDLVIPFVDGNDQVWRKQFVKFCITHRYEKKIASMNGQRFNDIGLLEYLIKGVYKYMPFIRNVYLLVSNKEQIPLFIKETNVKVVLHQQFIPNAYLPTYNSTTIEMFLDKIPNLAEHFIYINDDMFPLKPLKESDFFENDKIKINFYNEEHSLKHGEFRTVCYRQYRDILNVMKKEDLLDNYIRPYHSFTPMIKLHCKEIKELLGDMIYKNIEPFRTIFQHNQYIYPIYEHLQYGTLPSDIQFGYIETGEGNNAIIEQLETKQIVCINDTGTKGLDIDTIKTKLKEITE